MKPDRPSARPDTPCLEDAAEHAPFRAALLAHYRERARDLPWRRTRDPYRIWVSEVMLQQTRVETVKGYYERWMERFPDLQSLAGASEDDVLVAWEGLGYYRRARNLLAAARLMRERYDGGLPRDVAGLRDLPGMGHYTAGAVASIAFGVPVPAVDGNVRRVLARLFDVARPGGAWLRRTATELVDTGAPGDFNQALMELGATVCVPASPECGACPVARWCAALERGTVAGRPEAKRRRPPPHERRVSAVVVDGAGRLLLQRRPPTGLLARMWTFPDAPLEGEERSRGDRAPAERADPVVETARGVAAPYARLPEQAGGVRLPEVRHRFTHLAVTYVPVVFRGEARVGSRDSVRWVRPAAPGVALPVAQRKILAAAAAHVS